MYFFLNYVKKWMRVPLKLENNILKSSNFRIKINTVYNYILEDALVIVQTYFPNF